MFFFFGYKFLELFCLFFFFFKFLQISSLKNSEGGTLGEIGILSGLSPVVSAAFPWIYSAVSKCLFKPVISL